MQGPGYVFAWIVLLLIPALAVRRRRWWPLAVYAVGFLIFLYAIRKENGEWNDLADFATLIVIVIPIYIIASILWVTLSIIDHNRKKTGKH
ncbi:hypothetical protein [Cohnella lupini]|uniref:Uncharacterized protein n=1 Tax=Cohnella lupini TaxID=1294267 RepID=A0A3D9HYZ0_9BACL|nr:hypothetical protein [Cohnella lupini]RED54717.1 hypothetical protein DFP95_12242 [Cohnella lupini]